ncbi:hypothetical protein WJX72_006244 [[Myrmecia] bisecta]|uniref:STEEP1 domain-containing protein n=1 Tax=[Myrmecia] bisecta TaxID=41462 RepID=A0AAW1PHM4_9CHLO
MPRRATLTFSSEDAPELKADELHVYYCKFSGRHALTTECNLSKAPTRRTDGSAVIDTKKYKTKLYTSDGGVKLLKRRNGAVEKQYRLTVGKLPVAYRSEPESELLYILEGALTSYSVQERGMGDATPVPPCILGVQPNIMQIALEVDDRADNPQLIKISADYVRIQISSAISHDDANEEILEFMRSMLSVRLGQLSLLRGESTRHKLLMVEGMTPSAAFEKLQAQLTGARAAPSKRAAEH